MNASPRVTDVALRVRTDVDKEAEDDRRVLRDELPVLGRMMIPPDEDFLVERLSAGSIVVDAVRLWWGAVGKLFLLNLIPTLVVAPLGIGLAVILSYSQGQANSSPAFLGMAVMLLAALGVGVPAFTANFFVLEEQANYGTVHSSVGAVFRQGARYFWDVVLAGFLMGLPVLLITAPTLLLFSGPQTLLVIGMGAAVLGVLLLKARWIAVWPAMTTEGLGASDALKRSWALTSGRMGTLVAAILLYLLVMLLASVTTALLAAIPFVGSILGLVATTLFVSLEYALYHAAFRALRTRC